MVIGATAAIIAATTAAKNSVAIMGVVVVANLPNSMVTPGALNPNVNQANIQTTICVPGWTKTIRPTAAYTNKLKTMQLSQGAYASKEPLSAFEEDHLVSLELGGHPTFEHNLWPQHWTGPYGAHQKDQLENYLHRAVCGNKMPLAQSQQEIAQDWVKAYNKYIVGK